MKYTVDYFIDKFEDIPEDNWVTGMTKDLELGCCVMGWCGGYFTDQTTGLIKILAGHMADTSNDFGRKYVYAINDGLLPIYQQLTPKRRILAALYDIRTTHTLSSKGVK